MQPRPREPVVQKLGEAVLLASWISGAQTLNHGRTDLGYVLYIPESILGPQDVSQCINGNLSVAFQQANPACRIHSQVLKVAPAMGSLCSLTSTATQWVDTMSACSTQLLGTWPAFCSWPFSVLFCIHHD